MVWLAVLGLLGMLGVVWWGAGPLVVLYIVVAVPVSVWLEMRAHRRWMEERHGRDGAGTVGGSTRAHGEAHG